ncbi:MAG: hypothetical protein AB7I27_13300 [Bacteriovoracaceae bacterium]
MTSFKLFFLIIGLTYFSPVFSQNREVKELCKLYFSNPEIHTSQDLFSPTSKLLMQIFPRLYLGVKNLSLEKKGSYIENSMSSGTIVFTLGKIIKKQDEIELRWAQIKRIKKDPFRVIFSTSSENECAEAAEKMGITDDLIHYLQKRMEGISTSEVLFNQGNRILRKYFNEEGEVVPFDSWYEIKNYIENLPPGRYNFIITFHADSDGRLYDYERLPIVAAELFKVMIPKARSFTFYSCYPDQVEKYYRVFFNKLKSAGVLVFRPYLKRKLARLQKAPLVLFEDFVSLLAHFPL